MSDTRQINLKDTAKIVRAALAEAFPGIKFSVRSQTYSMGCHINIHWVDGPRLKDVQAVADRFYGTGFNSSDDSTTRHKSVYKGEVVHFAGSRPSCLREISEQFEATCLQAWNALSAAEREKLAALTCFPSFPMERPGHLVAQITSVRKYQARKASAA